MTTQHNEIREGPRRVLAGRCGLVARLVLKATAMKRIAIPLIDALPTGKASCQVIMDERVVARIPNENANGGGSVNVIVENAYRPVTNLLDRIWVLVRVE